MNSENLHKEINNLKLEIEKDKSEFVRVPERFKTGVQLEIETKTNKITELENRLEELYELETTKRLQNILTEFQKTVDKFINDHPFQFKTDKEKFIATIKLMQNDNKLIALLREGEKAKNKNKYSKGRLIVIFPDGKEIAELKPAESFAKAIKEIGITKVKPLKIIVNRLLLIGEIKSNKYQQKKISQNCYLLTHMPNEKKKEILEYISQNLNLNLKVKLK